MAARENQPKTVVLDALRFVLRNDLGIKAFSQFWQSGIESESATLYRADAPDVAYRRVALWRAGTGG